jgi:hypothetical protein
VLLFIDQGQATGFYANVLGQVVGRRIDTSGQLAGTPTRDRFVFTVYGWQSPTAAERIG